MPGPLSRDDDYFVASVSDVRPLAAMLRSLSFRSKAVVEAMAMGIKFTVEEGRSIQANAYLTSTCFQSYSFNFLPPTPSNAGSDHSDDDDDAFPPPPSCVFGISLSTMLECLNIFGNAGPIGGNANGKEWKENAGRAGFGRKSGGEREERERREGEGKTTSCRMSYRGPGEPLVLLLEEGGIVTRCEITTYEPDALMDLPFDDEAKIQKLIMKSEWLRDALLEIDPSSDKLTITFSPAEHVPTPYNRYLATNEDEDGNSSAPTFRLESQGVLGSTTMDFPNDRDVLEVFDCSQTIQNSYKFSHVALTKQALGASTKTSIRTADDGLVSFQFMIPISKREQKEGFVEFLCVPLDVEY